MASHNSIFISYRRSDIPVEQVNLIHEGLENAFGKDTVFLDTADIHSGEKWKKILTDEGTNAKVCLVLIGPNWLVKDKDGINRILHEGDWVRQEIEYAIERNLVILPVLVNGGLLPKPENLPPSLQSFNESQAIPIHTSEWATYKIKLISDLKRYVPEKSKFKRWWLIALIPVLLTGSYFLYNWTHQPIQPSALTGPAVEPAIDTPIVTADLTCVPFKIKSELKTLIFPVHSADQEAADATSLLIDQAFNEKCKKYGIKPENQIASVPKNKPLTKNNKQDIANHCGADLYFSGFLIKEQNQSQFIADFNFTNDSILTYVASPEDFKISLTQFKVSDLLGNKSIDTWYEKIIQCLVGIFSYQKKDFKNTISALKDAIHSNIENDTLKKLAYTLIADSYYQLKESDSCIAYQQQIAQLFPLNQHILKAAVLAEQYKKPEVAILAYSKLIDSSTYDQNKLHEKRADQYNNIKDYQKAKEDYQKVKTVEPQQKERVLNKSKEVETKILNNKTAIAQVITNSQQMTDVQKIKIADKALQNGEVLKAQQLLQSIQVVSPEFKKAEPLLQEAQLKANPQAQTIITESAVKLNPRLKAEVILNKRVVTKSN